MDINDIKTIVELMKSHDLTHFEWDRDGVKLTLKRPGADVEAIASAMSQARAAMAAPVAVAAPVAAAPVPAAAAPEPVSDTIIIKSPMVGTFYRASGPGAAVFTEVGSAVTPESVVCIVEAMKVMNEIKAECRGTIVRILVPDATPVMYGTPLFEVRPA